MNITNLLHILKHGHAYTETAEDGTVKGQVLVPPSKTYLEAAKVIETLLQRFEKQGEIVQHLQRQLLETQNELDKFYKERDQQKQPATE